MAEWRIELRGDQWDLNILVSELCSPEVSVIKEQNVYYLQSVLFAAMNDAAEVLKEGRELLSVINGAAKLQDPGFGKVDVCGVAYLDDEGKIHQYILAESIVSDWKGRSRASVHAVDADGNPLPDGPTLLETRTKLASMDKAVKRALRMWSAFAHDWVNLYKILEVVEADVGSQIMKGGWATGAEVECFKHTANSYLATGDDARHAHTRQAPPKRPMSIQEAEGLIRSVLISWLESKHN